MGSHRPGSGILDCFENTRSASEVGWEFERSKSLRGVRLSTEHDNTV